MILLVPSSVVIANILSESVPHILVLLIPTGCPLRHTLTHVMVVSAVTTLHLSFVASPILRINLLIWSVLMLSVRVGVWVSGHVWGCFNLEANIVVNLRELKLF